jgi:hypothetical protein
MNKGRVKKLVVLSTALAIVVCGGGVAAANAPEKKAKAKVVLADDFSDDSNGWGTNALPGKFDVGVDEGTFTFNLLADTAPPVQWPDKLTPVSKSLVNQRVDVDADWEGGAVPAPACRVNPDTAVADYSLYFFGVRDTDGAGLIVKINEDGSQQKLIESTKPVADTSAKHVRLGGDCVNKKGGVALTLRVDGKPALKTVDKDNPITRPGTLGLTAYGDGKNAAPFPVKVAFDNFKAYRLK